MCLVPKHCPHHLHSGPIPARPAPIVTTTTCDPTLSSQPYPTQANRVIPELSTPQPLLTYTHTLSGTALVIASAFALTMAAAANCNHSFKKIKSDTNLVQWSCTLCHSGPYPFIFECQNCKLKVCQPCQGKA